MQQKSLKSVLTLLTPDLRQKVEEHIEGMSTEDKERVYAEVLSLYRQGFNEGSDRLYK